MLLKTSAENKIALRSTFGYYLLFICLGLSTSLSGPTLPALAEHTHTELGRMGLLFLFGAAGFSIGTYLGGRIFDRVRGHPVLGLAQLSAALFLLLIPLAPWFWLLLMIVACKGLAEGVVNTGGNTLLVWTHRERVGPFMNGLHFFFGVGAFVGPLLIAQVAGSVGGYRWAYWLVAAIAALAGLRLFRLGGSPAHEARRDEGPGQPASAPIYYPVVIAAMAYLFFYVGAEISFGGWIYTYAVLLKLASAVSAAYLTSGFWLSFTLGRLVSIPMAARFRPQQIILTALLACLAVMLLLIVAPGSSLALWVSALGLGFGMAPIWPTGFTLAGQSLKLTGRVSAIILLGDSFGAMLLPWLAGRAIGALGPRAMAYLVFGSLVCNLTAFTVMVRLRPPGLAAARRTASSG